MSDPADRQWPSKSQWGQFFKVLNKKEKKIFLVLLIIAVSSFLSLSFSLYFNNTQTQPQKGGTYTEGVLGSPRFINPIYAAASDVDRDLTELIYPGLMKYDEEGKIIPELIKEYKVLDQGRIYEFYLKEDLVWQDGQPLTAEDVIFTIKTIQNPSFKSPLRSNWLGVKVEKISEMAVRFELSNSSAIFLENCTQKILPKHIWEEISYQNLPLSIYNLKPVGAGPYKFKDLRQDNQGNIRSMELSINSLYVGPLPSIQKIVFFFYDTEKEVFDAFKSGKVKGMSLLSLDDYQKLNESKFTEYNLSLPRYFAVFFNPEKSEILEDPQIREALSYGTNKEEIVNQVLLGKGKTVDSPILPEIYGFESPENSHQFDREKAKSLITAAGFEEKDNGFREKIVNKTPSFQLTSNLQQNSKGNEVTQLQKCLAQDSEVYPEGTVSGYFGPKTKEAVIRFQEKYKSEILTPYNLTSGTGKVYKSTRAKLNKLCFASLEETISLSFTLATVDQPNLVKVARILKEQWKELGINLNIQALDIATLEEGVIKPRSYEMLLFGEVLTAVPDPYPFWHSSQKKDPGLNLANYDNKNADNMLEDARQTLDQEQRKESLEKFQDLFLEDLPALLLYGPDYLYLVSKEIKGIETQTIIDPSKRLSNITDWYIKTKRVW